MRHRAAGRAAAARRADRAVKASEGLAETLADAVSRQMRTVVTSYRRAARAAAGDALVAAAGDDQLAATLVPVADLWDPTLWEATLDEVDVFVTDFVIGELQTEFGIRVTSEQPFVAGRAAEHVAEIERWSQELKGLVGQTIDEAHRQTMSIPDTAEALMKAGVESERRATLIARTEMISASNAASHVGALAFAGPGDTKVWLAASDERTRATHRRADGQTVKFDEPFVVGSGHRADYPGARSLPVAERANCRCTWQWVPGDEPPETVAPVVPAAAREGVKMPYRDVPDDAFESLRRQARLAGRPEDTVLDNHEYTHEKWYESLSPEEHDALVRYTGNLFSPLSRAMFREGMEGVKDDRLLDVATKIKAALDRHPTRQEPVTVFRGVKSNPRFIPDVYQEMWDLDVGDEITLNTFTSTSLQEEVGEGFGFTGYNLDNGNPANVIFKVKTWQGANIIQDSVFDFKEAEVLLNTGTKLRVTKLLDPVSLTIEFEEVLPG